MDPERVVGASLVSPETGLRAGNILHIAERDEAQGARSAKTGAYAV